MRILLDGMGGDNAPEEIVRGAVDALAESDYEIIIVGRKEDIDPCLEKYDHPAERLQVVNASEVIENAEAPVKAVRTKKDSSMVKALNMLKDGEGDVMISAGNTGAYMAGSLLVLKSIKGIERPAIASIYPRIGGEPGIIVDAGANSACSSWNLRDFAVMGALYMEKVMGRENASVGLINIGTEENKGTRVTREAYDMLRDSGLNFVGNVEARDVPTDPCDVLVCDGFTGNVVLKLTEGLALNIMRYISDKLTEGVLSKVGAAMLLPKFRQIKRELNYEEYGGAPILGVNGHVIKMHGSSKAFAVKNAILKGATYAEQDIVGKVSRAMEEIYVEQA